MKDNDIVVSMGEDNEETMNGFFGNLNAQQKTPSKKAKPAPSSSSLKDSGIPEPVKQTPQMQPRSGGDARRQASAWTSMRISDSAKSTIYRAHQCYDIATGRRSSMSDFLELCVRRALPRISKEASDIFRNAIGATGQANLEDE